MYNADMGRNRKIGSAHSQLFTNLISVFDVYTKLEMVSPQYLTDFNFTLHSSAYKKYGHTGDQVQINIPDSEEAFTQLQRFAFQDDALVMLRYDYL